MNARRAGAALRLAAAVVASLSGTAAAQPANNTCVNAITVSNGNTPFSTFGATTDIFRPGPHCLMENDVWFRYTASCTGDFTVSLCGSHFAFDSHLVVYESGDCPPGNQVGCNNDSCGSRSSLTISMTQGLVYTIRVGGENMTNLGQLSITPPAPPGNDACAAAFTISNDVVVSTLCATTDGPAGPCAVNQDVWYEYRAPTSGTLSLDACFLGFDARMAVYSSESCPASGLMACVDLNPNCTGDLALPVVGGATYRIRIGDGGAASGSFLLDVDGPSAPSPAAKRVRFVYLIPNDRFLPVCYKIAIQRAAEHVQRWYHEQIGTGETFSLSNPVVETYSVPHPAAYYASHANGDDSTYYFWNNVLNDAFALTGGQFNDPNNIWIYYIDADYQCGQVGGGGTSGVAVMPANDLRGLTGQAVLHICPNDPFNPPYCRWLGGLAHELGHALGLPHPAACDDNNEATPCPSGPLMGTGYYNYPGCTLLPDNITLLNASPFIVPVALTAAPYPCSGGIQHPTSQAVCPGQPVTFTVAAPASLTPPIIYQWQRDGVNISGAIGSSYTIASVAPGDAGVYRCSIGGSCFAVFSNGAVLTVRSAPAITQQPIAQSVTAGQSAAFSVAATGSAPLSYQWRRGGTPLSNGGGVTGATTPNLAINPAAIAHAGSYTCAVTNSCGTLISSAASLTVYCPGDWNQSGDMTPADVAAFVSAWAQSLIDGTLVGDFNGDGSVTPSDVGAFVNAWFAGLTDGC